MRKNPQRPIQNQNLSEGGPKDAQEGMGKKGAEKRVPKAQVKGDNRIDFVGVSDRLAVAWSRRRNRGNQEALAQKSVGKNGKREQRSNSAGSRDR